MYIRTSMDEVSPPSNTSTKGGRFRTLFLLLFYRASKQLKMGEERMPKEPPTFTPAAELCTMPKGTAVSHEALACLCSPRPSS